MARTLARSLGPNETAAQLSNASGARQCGLPEKAIFFLSLFFSRKSVASRAGTRFAACFHLDLYYGELA
jgi:hypothetical protein